VSPAGKNSITQVSISAQVKAYMKVAKTALMQFLTTSTRKPVTLFSVYEEKLRCGSNV